MAIRHPMDNVVILDRSVPYPGYLRVESVRLKHRLANGEMGPEVTREILRRPDAVAVLPRCLETGRYALVRQFRYAAHANGDSGWITEAIAGVIDEGESPAHAASREVNEECGLEVSNMRACGVLYASPGTSTERFHLFLADAARARVRANSSDDLEDIEVVWRTCEELRLMALNDEVQDVKTLALIQRMLLEHPSGSEDRP